MSPITVTRTIQAPAAVVFEAVTDIESLPKSNPDVVRVEFLSETRSGPGTRFRETRRAGKREAVTELELTEWVENQHARFVADTGGTVWDTAFRVRPVGDACELTIELDARPHTLLARIVSPLIRGMVRRGMEKHVGSLADYCEARAA